MVAEGVLGFSKLLRFSRSFGYWILYFNLMMRRLEKALEKHKVAKSFTS